MKLALIYNVFDGEELLEGSIEQLRSQASCVIAVVQKVGNHGDVYTGGFDKCQELQEKGLIDACVLFEPEISEGQEQGPFNEKKKRQAGIETAKAHNCTHFLLIDCDEYYDSNEFGKAISYIEENNLDATVAPICTYFKFPQWQIEGFEDYYVPFIHRLYDDTVCGVPNYPYKVDSTRTANHSEQTVLLDASLCVMHHYSWVREDIDRKINNSSAKGYLRKYYQRLMGDYKDATVGSSLFHWKGKKIIAVENAFGIKGSGFLSSASEAKLLIKFPTRDRPEKLVQVLQQYYDLLEDPSRTWFLVSCDVDDIKMNQSELIQRLQQFPNLQVLFHPNKSKIEAVNAGMNQAPPFDIILLASDDMIPQEKGYDQRIRNNMFRYFPDTDGVLWFNDGVQEDRLNTLCILGRAYYQRFGYIYHPAYRSLWCDNEFTQVSIQLKRQAYFPEVIIQHEHHSTYQQRPDALYVRNEQFNDRDFQTFKARKKKNFDLPQAAAWKRFWNKLTSKSAR